jgi:hypothetical protein
MRGHDTRRMVVVTAVDWRCVDVAFMLVALRSCLMLFKLDAAGEDGVLHGRWGARYS